MGTFLSADMENELPIREYFRCARAHAIRQMACIYLESCRRTCGGWHHWRIWLIFCVRRLRERDNEIVWLKIFGKHSFFGSPEGWSGFVFWVPRVIWWRLFEFCIPLMPWPWQSVSSVQRITRQWAWFVESRGFYAQTTHTQGMRYNLILFMTIEARWCRWNWNLNNSGCGRVFCGDSKLPHQIDLFGAVINIRDFLASPNKNGFLLR